MKYCVLPFAEFWEALEALGQRAVDLNLRCYAKTSEDTPANRHKAYNAVLSYLRANNELCEHPSHNHKPTEN